MAIGLLHQNIPCTVYEAAPAFAEIGAGVSFGINALNAMSLIDPKVKEAFDRCATSNGSPDKKTHYFDFRIGMKEEGWSAMKGGAPANEGTEVAEVIAADIGQASVHRAHFLDELVKLIPEGVAKFGKRVQEVERKGEKMQMTFCDGTTAYADAVVGCDGIKSRTRQIVLGEDHPAANAVYSGWYAYRGLIPMEKAALALGDDLARNSQIYMGHGAHVLTFPIEHGKVMNVVAFQTKKKTWDDEAWVLPMRRDQMLDDFKDWDDKVKDMLSVGFNII
jgi:salicylate hydroxylase